jgi:hypothetical protein
MNPEKQIRLRNYQIEIEAFRSAVHRLYSCRESIIRLQDQPQSRERQYAAKLFGELVGFPSPPQRVLLAELAKPVLRLVGKYGARLDRTPILKIIHVERVLDALDTERLFDANPPEYSRWPVPAEIDLLLDDLIARLPGSVQPITPIKVEEAVINFVRKHEGATYKDIAEGLQNKGTGNTYSEERIRTIASRLVDAEKLFRKKGTRGYFTKPDIPTATLHRVGSQTVIRFHR